MKKILFIILLFIGFDGSIVNAQNYQAFETDTLFANISVAQANDTINAHARDPFFIVLDVRTPGEYTPKHIEGAINLNFNSTSTFQTDLNTLDKNKTYLIHCASGGRSGQAFVMMQNLHFAKVYNMLGGLNAWNSALFPTTALYAPKIGLLSDSVVTFNSTAVLSSDTIYATITNYKNDTLRIDSIPEINPDFSTNFDISKILGGARNYTFKFIYSPKDNIADSTKFIVYSNGGEAHFYLIGHPLIPTLIVKQEMNSIRITSLPNSKYLVNTGIADEQAILDVINISGKTIQTTVFNSSVILDLSAFPVGIYFLNVKTKDSSLTRKLVLIE